MRPPRRLKDIEDHLERADARYDRFVLIQEIERRNRDKARRFKVAVAIFALICSAYAILNNLPIEAISVLLPKQ